MGASVSFDSAKWASGIKNEVDIAKDNFLDEASAYMVADMRSAFETEGKRDGVAKMWLPVKLTTLLNRVMFPKRGTEEAKLSYLKNAKPLVDTGALRDSVSKLKETSQAGVDSVWLGASVPYAKDMEKGKDNTPPRPFHFFSQANIDKIKGIFRRFFGA